MIVLVSQAACPVDEAIDHWGTLCWQVFFAAVGANGSLAAVMGTAPALFAWCFVQIAVHLAIILGVGRLLRFSLRDLLLASNANVRSRMAASKSANVIDGLIAQISWACPDALCTQQSQ